MKVTVQAIDKASKTLEKVARNTPLQFNKRLSEQFGAKIYIKREDLQDVRSYKIRGAYNRMSSLTDKEKLIGVVTASAGNHAQGVALSANLLKIKATIFMPQITPLQKINKVKYFGKNWVNIQLVGQAYDETSEAAHKYGIKNKMIYVHPFDDPLTISGQGTIAKEIYEKLDGKLDIVLCPIGGGGLIAGVGTFLKSKNNNIKIIGVEPKGAAAMHQSFIQKRVVTLKSINTFVDGAAVSTVGKLNFKITSAICEKILLCDEGKICSTMIDLYQYEGIIAEPAGALSISALDDLKSEIKGKTVVCILSGGNNDILRYPEIMEKSLVYKELKHYFLIEFAQKPGQLKEFLNSILGPTDDIVLFEYIKKTQRERGPALVGIELTDKKNLEPLIKKMDLSKISYTKISADDPLYSFVL